MGLWDALTNVFTGQPAIDAANNQRAYLTGVQGNVNDIYSQARNQGIGTLQGALPQGIGALQSGVGQGENYITSNMSPAIASLTGNYGAGIGALGAGQQGALGVLQGGVSGAAGAYSPLGMLGSLYSAGAGDYSNMLRNAYGLNGPEGNAAATSAFQAGPGYQWQLGQGIDAITRAQNAAGMGASGNTLRAAQNYGQGLASQQYQNWLTGLTGQQGTFLQPGLNALTSAAGGVGNALLTGGTGGANIYTGTGNRLADLYSNLGTNTANIYTGAGGLLSNLALQGGVNAANLYQTNAQQQAQLLQALASGQGTADLNIAQQYSPTYQQEANAQIGGSRNLWNLIGGAATAAASGGMGGLIGSGLSSLGNLGGSLAFQSINPQGFIGSGQNWYGS